MFCFKPEKTKHKPVLINAIRCCCTIKFSASLLTNTDSTRFWQIWYLSVPLVFADYIYTWTNLNPVINAGKFRECERRFENLLCKRVQLCCFRDLRTVDELSRIPRFASFFRIFALFVSSFLRICWSMKALASIDSFFGLLERGKFATELVRRSFLIKRVIPERLTCNPSLFKVLNIPAGWKPWLYRSSIRVLV